MSMSQERIKGFMTGGLYSMGVIDKDRFIERTEKALAHIKKEKDKDIEAVLDELIEEGWVEYNQKGNNIQATTPEGVSTGDSNE